MSNLEHIVEFEPAWDKRDKDPAKNYGIHGVALRMVVKGDKGAVQFLLYTNWMLPHVTKELEAREASYSLFRPLPADLGYHSPTPHFEGQMTMGPCKFLDGKPCYYDGSGLNADRIWQVLLIGGSESVWKELEAYYSEVFL